MRHILTIGLVCLVAPTLLAARTLDAVPPTADAIAQAAQNVRPWRFALATPAVATPATHGQWSDDGLLWSLDLRSAGAQSLSVHLDRFVMGAGAELWFVSDDGTLRHGPYTSRHGRKQRLFTPIVRGDSGRLELKLATPDAIWELSVAELFHGFRDMDQQRSLAKSGGCNIDVECQQGDAWRDQIDSTVSLVFDGSTVCSGVLLNNARNDLTPYVLTADHCMIGAQNDDSVNAYWNYQTAECRAQSENARPVLPRDLSMRQTGSEFLADGRRESSEDPDFTLLVLGSRLNPEIPDPAFNVFWSGWDVTEQAVTSGVGIHHPAGHEKAIAVFSTPADAQTSTVVGIGRVPAWRIFWSDGTTEGGSSGSGLWNQDGRVVGQLAGGSASCDAIDDPDYYGRLGESWEWENSLNRQLRGWLDPDCTNPGAINGMRGDEIAAGVTPASAVGDATLCDPGTPPPPPPPPPRSSGGSGAANIWLFLLLALRGLVLRRPWRGVRPSR